MNRILLCLAASVVLVFAGNQPKPAAKSPTPAVSDVKIEQTLKAKLAKSKIGANHFTFRVQGGIVYWNGSTNVVQHKGAATRMAKSSGAKAVVNHIQVSEAARSKARANLAEGRRRVQVKRSDTRSDARN